MQAKVIAAVEELPERLIDLGQPVDDRRLTLEESLDLIDGNQRIDAVATLAFLHVNGFDVAITQAELAALFAQLAGRGMEQEELDVFLRSRAVLAVSPGR